MRARFGSEDEEAFHAAQESLLASYVTADSLAGGGPDGYVASTMLEYKWGYGDGRIYDWRRSDLETLLLSHFPRKVTIDEEDLLLVAPEIADFLAFLDGRGLLTGDPLPRLREGLEELDPEFVDAMQDPSRFGPAKRIVAQMRSEGVDLDEPGALDRWMDEFNARSAHERDDILGGRETEPGFLPPIELPPAEELERSALASPTLARLTALARYVGRGRKLTQQGHLTLADGRVLVELLGSGDELDPRVGARVFRTRSTSDLPNLDLCFRWARACGFVKVRHGRVSITRRGASLGGKPLEDWRAAFDGFLKLESTSSSRGRRRLLDGPLWSEVMGELLARVPYRLYGRVDLEVEALHEAAWLMVDARFYIDPEGDMVDHIRRMVGYEVDRLLGDLAQLGAVTVVDGRVALTPLGLWGTNLLLSAAGVVAPVLGEHVRWDAADLLRACAAMPLDAAEHEFRSWIEGRPATAARELADAARSGELSMLALYALGFAGPAAEAEVRALLEIDSLRPKAQLWLVQHDYEDPSSLPRETLQAALLEALAAHVDADGPVAMIAFFNGLGPEDEQIRFVEGLLRADHGRASEMLQLIGRSHPSKVVAKAARTTAFKRQAIGPS